MQYNFKLLLYDLEEAPASFFFSDRILRPLKLYSEGGNEERATISDELRVKSEEFRVKTSEFRV